MENMDYKNKLVVEELKKINKKIDNLDKRLSKHIDFIEKVYAPLTSSICSNSRLIIPVSLSLLRRSPVTISKALTKLNICEKFEFKIW